MIRVAVLTRSEPLHRELHAAMRDAPDLAIAVRLRSLRELRSTRGIDVIIADAETLSDATALYDLVAPTPVVLLDDDAVPAPAGAAASRLDGYARLQDRDPRRILAAARAAAFGLVVGEHPADSIESVDDLPESGGEQNVGLTPRELQVLGLLSRGRSNAEIAADLGVSQNTVKFHLGGVFAKLDVRSRSEATFRAIQLGLVSL
jgi:DNA-binding NarL/FixJ family response regulator